MAWQVALAPDTETDLNVAIGEMPIWAQTTPRREAYPEDWRERWSAMWHPEPGFTLITTPPTEDLVEGAAAVLPTIAEHHPNLFCIHIFGVPKGDRLNAAMAEHGFYPALIPWDQSLAFARPIEQLTRDLLLDAANWNLKSDWDWLQDFYAAFFLAVGAPEWHGRNFNAPHDSITGGGINKIEVPYRMVIRNAPRDNEAVTQIVDSLSDLIVQIQSKGCPVSFLVED